MEPEVPRRLPDSKPQRAGRGPWRTVAWVLAVVFIIVNRCGFADDLFGDPTGEQVISASETELQAAGLSDDTWDCIESKMRDGGYMDNLNEVSVSEVGTALESPFGPQPPELTRFVAGLQIHMDPSRPNACMSAQEAASLNLPDA